MAAGSAPEIERALTRLRTCETWNVINYFGENITIPCEEIRAFARSTNANITVYSVAIGLCVCVIMVLAFFLAIRKHDRKPWTRPITLISFTNLVLVVIAAGLQAFLSTSRIFGNPLAVLFLSVPTQHPVLQQILGETVLGSTLLIYFGLMVAFLLQVRAVFASSKKVCLWLTVLFGIVGLAVIGLFVTCFTISIKSPSDAEILGPGTTYAKVIIGRRITFILYVVLSSFCFMGKLGSTIVKRRRAGITSFENPLQILMIVSFHSLVIPVIFYTFCEVDLIPASNGVVVGLAVLASSFPVSKIWTSAAAGREEELYGLPPETVPSKAPST